MCVCVYICVCVCVCVGGVGEKADGGEAGVMEDLWCVCVCVYVCV